jgi:DNA (cytosine-5)-methyltransferase 1
MLCLDLFSGIGGMTMNLDVEYVSLCEIDPHARAILQKRLPGVPIHDDVRTLDPTLLEPFDIITAGFPCQDISSSGLRKGFEGEKSSLYHQVVRIVKLSHPKYVYLENVANIVQMPDVMQTVVDTLSSEGYDLRWCTIKASHCGCPMSRKRWFCLAQKVRAPCDSIVQLPPKIPANGSVVAGQCQPATLPPMKIHGTAITLVPIQGETGCKGKVLKKTLHRSVWATPRCNISYACRNLTKRSSFDLATMLRFDVNTPDDQRHYKNPSIEFVEWLQGFPIGYTDIRVEKPVAHNHWTKEPARRMAAITKFVKARHWRLGNACVPAMSLRAFTILNQ